MHKFPRAPAVSLLWISTALGLWSCAGPPTARREGSGTAVVVKGSCGYDIVLPREPGPIPEPLPPERSAPGFPLRGTKGWAWTPEQYLAEIPYLARMKMNFLMNCYLSMFADPEKLDNRWWEPIPEAKKRAYEEVVRACQKAGIDFCFAVHPVLYSKRPLRTGSEEDFRDLWQHYAWMQGLGVRWFSLSYDDIGVEGEDKPALGEAHARLANRLISRLREKDPVARLIFCPVYYWGAAGEAEARAYLQALGDILDPEIDLFWTGDDVITRTITVAAAEAYKRVVRHRLIIWDNYPVNDRTGALHLGPVTGREPGLAAVASGYMSNPHAPQNEINRIPLFTCADFAYNPWDYDPARAIGRAIMEMAKSREQRQALADLVGLYPGDLICGVPRTDYNCLVEEYKKLAGRPGSEAEAAAFAARAERVIERFEKAFPEGYSATKATLRKHLAALGERTPKSR